MVNWVSFVTNLKQQFAYSKDIRNIILEDGYHLSWTQCVNPLAPGEFNTGSGNGLVPSDNKPLPESVLIMGYVVIWRHWTTITWTSFILF